MTEALVRDFIKLLSRETRAEIFSPGNFLTETDFA